MFKEKYPLARNNTKSSINNLCASSCFFKRVLLPKKDEIAPSAIFGHFLVGYIYLVPSSLMDCEPPMSLMAKNSTTNVTKNLEC
jgi:hypothetical protein